MTVNIKYPLSSKTHLLIIVSSFQKSAQIIDKQYTLIPNQQFWIKSKAKAKLKSVTICVF